MWIPNRGRMLGLACVFGASLWSQNVSSNIVGIVADPANAVVPGASVRLTSDLTGEVRTVSSNAEGLFRFVNLEAGTYSVAITAQGFRTRVEHGINLSSSETRDLGQLKLEIGSVSEEMSVTAQSTPVQTSSSEQSALVEGSQLNDVTLRGRDLFGYMRMLPGIVDTTVTRDVTSETQVAGITINGNTSDMLMMVDGVINMDTGSNSTTQFEPNIDAIEEVKVLGSNYQAEYGRNSGGTISVLTKAGTREFHGTGWWTHRHEEFNANDYFNNETGLSRPLYRYNVEGWSLGGPIFVPRHFNVSRTKLFFFGSQEYTGQLVNPGVQTKTMPTALERQGNFSQSLGSNGALIVIKDPSTGAPYPGNIIPQSELNSYGIAMLNFLPMPNFNPAPGSLYYHQANFQTGASATHPRRNDVARADWYITPKLNTYFRWMHDYDDQTVLFQSNPWDYAPLDHNNSGHGYAAVLNYTFSPTMVNSLTVGKGYTLWAYYEKDPAQLDRSLLNNPPGLFPIPTTSAGYAISPYQSTREVDSFANYIPAVSFGSTPANAASFGPGPYADYANWNNIWSFNDNLTKIEGNHSFKVGAYIEHNWHNQASLLSPGYVGSYSFAPDTANPLNTGDGFANAAIGDYDSFSQANGRTINLLVYWDAEWYLQDSWRATRRLTLEYGVRFYHQTPVVNPNNIWSYFSQSAYSLSAVPRIYVPGLNSSGQRVAVDPGTGATAPQAEIGLFVPGTGNPGNGMLVAGQNRVPLQTYSHKPVAVAPRFGFAYDLFGNGKTAIRGGLGVFYNQFDENRVSEMGGQSPVIYTAYSYYGNISSLANSTGIIGPTSVSYLAGHVPIDQVRNASIGIQQSLGWGTVLGASYVGNWGLNQPWTVNLNAIPLGADFNPKNADPTKPGGILPSALLRVNYPGYLDITQYQFGGKTNYNALQVNVRRSFAQNFSMQLAYTWSRSLGMTVFDPLVPNNYERNWGPLSTNRPQVLAVNFIYYLPRPGRALHNRVVSAVGDGWIFSGLFTASSGAPYTPSFTSTVGADITGSASETPRINVVGDAKETPTLPGTYFNTSAFAEPAVGTIGNAGVNILRQHSYSNFDLALGKTVPIGLGEKRVFKLRLEAYNALNHPEFTTVNSTAQFNAAGVQTNASFGLPSADRGPRILSLDLRFQF
jgi:hypothetical protein